MIRIERKIGSNDENRKDQEKTIHENRRAQGFEEVLASAYEQDWEVWQRWKRVWKSSGIVYPNRRESATSFDPSKIRPPPPLFGKHKFLGSHDTLEEDLVAFMNPMVSIERKRRNSTRRGGSVKVFSIDLHTTPFPSYCVLYTPCTSLFIQRIFYYVRDEKRSVVLLIVHLPLFYFPIDFSQAKRYGTPGIFSKTCDSRERWNIGREEKIRKLRWARTRSRIYMGRETFKSVPLYSSTGK